jgi:hypothetical protein
LVPKLKDTESIPNSNYDSDNNKRREIIDAETNITITTTIIQLEEPKDPKEGGCLFHSQMWVKGTPLHFIVNRERQKNLVLAEVIKQLDFPATPHPQPYNIGWLCQRQGLCVSQ